MSGSKQQFNVYLDAQQVAAAKHRAIDDSLSVSALVAKALENYMRKPAVLKLQPMIHVSDMDASVGFYTALGGTVVQQSRGGDWAQIAIGGAEIGLLAHPPNPEQSESLIELNFESETSLEELQEQLQARGVSIARGAADEAFGAQLQLQSPEGLLVKINHLDPATFE